MNQVIPTNETTEKSFWQKQAELWRQNGKAGVARSEIKIFTCGTMSPKYLANISCQGLGPPAIRQGREVIHPLETLVPWLEARTQTIKHRRAGGRGNG